MAEMIRLAGRWPKGQKLYERLIIEAYDRPRYSGVSYQRRSIEEFHDREYLRCAKAATGTP